MYAIKQKSQIHIVSHDVFGECVDIVYKHKNLSTLFSLSGGYPSSGLYQLPSESISILNPISKGKEKSRPGYSWEASGSLVVRNALIEYENMTHSTNYALSNITIVAGASYGFSRVIEYLYRSEEYSDKRDELLVIYPTFFRMVGRASDYAKIVNLKSSKENNFQITIAEIVNALTRKTKAVFILNPSNPTYLYYTAEFMGELVEVLSKKGIFLIIDESGDTNILNSEGKNYNGISKGIDAKNVIRILTASKKYMLAEYRIGYVLGDSSIIGDKSKGLVKMLGDDMCNPPLAADVLWLDLIEHEIRELKNEKCPKIDCDYSVKFKEISSMIVSNRSYAINRLKPSCKITTQ
jgi:aspartate/methionine/tyrosine aminotransferase